MQVNLITLIAETFFTQQKQLIKLHTLHCNLWGRVSSPTFT